MRKCSGKILAAVLTGRASPQRERRRAIMREIGLLWEM